MKIVADTRLWITVLSVLSTCSAGAQTVPDQIRTRDDPVSQIEDTKPHEEADAVEETLDILLIGNSYTASAGGQNNLLSVLLRARGYHPDIHTYLRAGETLQGFVLKNDATDELGYWEQRAYDRQETAETKLAYRERTLEKRKITRGGLDAAIDKRKWDVVVIQVWTGASMPSELDFQNSLTRIVEKVRGKNRDARIVLYMVWSSQNRPDQQGVISESCRKGAERLGLVLAPVGEAAWKILAERGDMRFFRTKKDSHPGYVGGYLIACTLFAAITGATPVGLPTTLSLPANYDFPVPVRTPDRDRKIHELGPGPNYTFDVGANKGATLQAAAWKCYRLRSEQGP